MGNSERRDGADAPDGAPPESSNSSAKKQRSLEQARSNRRRVPRERYAALDLGTNNCRLLIAAPQGRKLRIVDAYSKIVRLGEGLSSTGVLSDKAMDRALEAIGVCSRKIEQRGVTHMRCIATQACRSAENGEYFIERVREETGLTLEVITAEEEARLAVAGCSELIDHNAAAVLLFDIGGGSTEISWLKIEKETGKFTVAAWMSMPIGVVSLSEKWGGSDLTDAAYEGALAQVREALTAFGDPAGLRGAFENGNAHFLGTSGTVTSIAGLHLALPRYRRDRVDGLWLSMNDARAVTNKLRTMSLKERANEPCIGEERADLVVCGCAILEALAQEWPVARVRVADRGLREGLLSDLAKKARRERKRRRRRTRSG
ncbi:MAG: Ppx/GppA phosphatase family protein [Pseudomonadota bacterium]